MKFTAFLFLALVYFSTEIAAQAPATDSQTLNQQIASLYQQGKFDDAIPIGKRVVEIENKAGESSETYAIALMNLGMLYKERMRILQKKRGSIKFEELAAFNEKVNDDTKNAEESFRRSLAVYTKLGQNESISSAALKDELGWVLHNNVAIPTTGGPRARIDEAEKLFTEVLLAREKLGGAESSPALKSVLDFGNFYMRWINFEKALPFYERYVSTVEKNDGLNSKSLVPALRGMAELMVVTDRPNEARELAKRISLITGKAEDIPQTSPSLALRGRKIERVKIKRFTVADAFDNPYSSLSYPNGDMPVGGRVRIRHIGVNILVDGEGNVADAKVIDPSAKDYVEIIAAARRSKFRPYSYKGVAQKMRGTLIYPYIEN